MIIRLSKLFAPCPKCKSKDAERNYTSPRIWLHAGGVALMERIHRCRKCGAVFAGPEEPANLTDILRWVIDTKTLTIKEGGVTVLIEAGGGTVAEIYIEKNECGDCACYRKTTQEGMTDGEVPISESDGSWDVLHRVIEDIKTKEAAKNGQ